MMKVNNISRSSELISTGRMANNPWTRLRGLIGVRNLPEGQGIVIEPCHGVHCMFMSIPIDVIYVNKQHQVVALDKAMQPWQLVRFIATVIMWSKFPSAPSNAPKPRSATN
jgi:uncharacterized membrane protein (UPF0127 family)